VCLILIGVFCFWFLGKFVPVGYGIKKLTISSVVVDDKVSLEDVEEQILAFEDYVSKYDIC
jgi:elongation factor 1-beta